MSGEPMADQPRDDVEVDAIDLADTADDATTAAGGAGTDGGAGASADPADPAGAGAATAGEQSGEPGGADPTDGDRSEGELAEEINAEIAQLAAERDQYKDIAQRLAADFENYRKRVAAQQESEIERATGAFAESLLPVLDAAEAAYLNHPDEVGPLLTLLLAELKKRGLEAVDLTEKPFDPNLADAVAHEPGDEGEPIVVEVLRTGYTWHGRTLRPAMVRTRGG